MLAEQARNFLAAVKALDPPPPAWEDLSPAEAREAFAGLEAVFGDGPEIKRVEDHTAGDGTALRLYDNCPGELSPVAFYFHGGGWVLGDLETHDAMCRRLAADSGVTIVSIDYPRSPEHQHPAALDTGIDVIADVVARAESLGIDRDRLAVAGDSAGGHLAACTAIRARDEAAAGRIDWRLKLQMLIYPVIEPDFETASYRDFATDYGLTAESMRYFWRCYLGDQEPSTDAYPTAAESLRDLPPAHIITAGHDVLRDEGQHYASELAAAGVPVTIENHDDMIHGFVHMAGVLDKGLEVTRQLGQVLTKHLQPPAATPAAKSTTKPTAES